MATFANNYMEPALRDQYRNHMQVEGFPANAVAKDLADLQGKLKRRRVLFTRDVQLSAPAAAFGDLIQIETIPSEDGDAVASWTRITVRDQIRDQQ